MDDNNEPQLYSSTAHLIHNEDRALAAQLAQSIGLIADWHLVRYHPRIMCILSTCLIMIILQVAIGTTGYFLPRLIGPQWLILIIVIAEAVNFLFILIVYVIQNNFLYNLKVRGYLLSIPSFARLRRAAMIIGCLYMIVNYTLLGFIQFECPMALRDPVNKTCENTWFLQEPYWLFYFISLVGEGALLTCAYILLSMRLIRFHLRASRGRLLPDILTELAELNINAGLGVRGMGNSNASRTPAESQPPNQNNISADRPSFNVPINTSHEVMEVHSRIVDIIDRPSSTDSLSRVIMERQADLLFYMHQRIECLQEELSQIHRHQHAA